jgi:hypothetical protein
MEVVHCAHEFAEGDAVEEVFDCSDFGFYWEGLDELDEGLLVFFHMIIIWNCKEARAMK